MIPVHSRSTAGLWPVAAILALSVAAMLASVPARAHDASTIPDLVARTASAVVSISATGAPGAKGARGMPNLPEGSPFKDFFEDFFERQKAQGKAGDRKAADGKANRPKRSLGTGFIISAEGHVVTAAHVVAGASAIAVNLASGAKLAAKVLGADAKTDIALLKVDSPEPLPTLAFGQSGNLRVGQPVVAIGNPYGLGGTVTTGVVSALDRDINAGPYDSFIQTDAVVTRGHAGGPLLDLAGTVIGMNTSILSPSGGAAGIAFAVPANVLSRVVAALRQHGQVARGWLGVRIQGVTGDLVEALGMKKPRGALVAAVTANSPAQRAGLKEGDVIVRFDGKDIPAMRDLPRIVAATAIGRPVSVEVLRAGKTQTFTVTLGRLEQRPKAAAAPASGALAAGASGTASLLGLTVTRLTDALRKTHKLAHKGDGVVVTKARPGPAADKGIRVGDTITEVSQNPVRTAAAFASAVDAARRSGRKAVLLLIQNSKGDLRFTAVKLPGQSPATAPGTAPGANPLAPGGADNDLDALDDLE